GSCKAVLKDLERLQRKVQRIDWRFLPSFLFAPEDSVVVIGRDGLVCNTAKYLRGQPIVGVNPDPARIDGGLRPFGRADAASAGAWVIDRRAEVREVTMAEVALNDGQRLLAFNDFYVGQRTHVSSRYSLTWRGRTERQSSSGVLVSTGAGSTGWFSSTQNMARAVSGLLTGGEAPALPDLRLACDDPPLAF